jgi:hypothetical protein
MQDFALWASPSQNRAAAQGKEIAMSIRVTVWGENVNEHETEVVAEFRAIC